MCTMSKVLLFIIRHGRAHLARLHFRDAARLLEDVENSLSSIDSLELDAGYVLMDLDQDLIINAQSAFPVPYGKYDVLEA